MSNAQWFLLVGGLIQTNGRAWISSYHLGFLVAARGEHRRERLCSLLFEGPDDPRAQLERLKQLSADDRRRLLDEARRAQGGSE